MPDEREEIPEQAALEQDARRWRLIREHLSADVRGFVEFLVDYNPNTDAATHGKSFEEWVQHGGVIQ